MSTRFASTIDNCDIAAKRAQCDYDGNNIANTYAKKSDVKDGELMVRFGDGQYSSLFSANTDATCYLDLAYRTYNVNEQTHTTTFFPGYPTLADMQAIYTQPDWNASSGVAAIKNKPTIPTVNNGTLTIQQGSTTLGTFTANQAGNTTVTISDPSALPKRYFYVEQDGAVTHTSANAYYSLRYTWPSGIDTDKDYIAQFMINIDKPKSELTQLNNADLPFEVSVETVGAFHFADAAGVMTCLNGSFANYYGSSNILVRVPSTYFTDGNGLNFLTYFPHVLTAADTFSFKIAGYFVEAP